MQRAATSTRAVMSAMAQGRDVSALASTLTRRELGEVLSFSETCAHCHDELELEAALRRFGEFLHYEFLLYAYMKSAYRSAGEVCLRNLSNPAGWMQEYEARGYLAGDPVRRELEVRLAARQTLGVIIWDDYQRKLAPIEEEVIARRSAWGLRTGFSAFCNSPTQDSVFLISFGTRRQRPPSERVMLLGSLVVPHLNRCRKRLDLATLTARLTEKEKLVAQWVVEGKTNWEIASIMNVSEATAKFHVANILTKLGASSRQAAVAVLIAERYLA